MGQGSGLKHRTIRRHDHQFIRRLVLNHTETLQVNCFSIGWTDAWIGILSGSSDGSIQIIQYRPECEAFSTGWSDVASVYSIGVLSGFQGSTAILARISDQMIWRSAGGNHRFIRRYYFSGDFFQRLASNARPINKPPVSLELPLSFWRSIAAKERRKVCCCHLGFSSSLLWCSS
jgi:hypothetical protein